MSPTSTAKPDVSLESGGRADSSVVVGSAAAEVSGNQAFLAGEAEMVGSGNESKPANAVAVSKETPRQEVAKPVEPTAEQLTRWSQPPWEPFQLLGCREWSKQGLATSMVGLPDGKHFLLAGTKVSLWSIVGDEPEHLFFEIADPSSEKYVRSMAIAADGKWFATGEADRMLRIWDIEERKERLAKKTASNDIVRIAISPDGQEMATIGFDSEIAVWSVEQLESKNRFKVNTSGLNNIAYLAPSILAAAGEKTSAWNTVSGKELFELSPGRYQTSLGRSPDGRRFVFGSEKGMQFWNIEAGKVEASLTREFAMNELVAFSPDGAFLVTANGSSLRFWDLKSTKLMQTIDVYGAVIVGLSWLPNTNLVLVASENGCTRLWGTAEVAASLAMSPMHSAVALPDESTRVPANSSQLLQAIDFRQFPQMPGLVPSIVDEFNLHGTAAASIEETKAFFRYFLQRDGWTESAAAPDNPGASHFRKRGFMVSASFFDTGNAQTSLSLNHAGNYDLRWAPKFDAVPIEIIYENEHIVMYKVKSDIVQLETKLLRQFYDAGWTPYSRLHTSHSEQVDQRALMFVRNGTTLHVTIAKSPDDPNKFHIQYGRFLTAHSLPIPRDCSFVEYDGSTQPTLVANSSMSLSQACEFYDSEMRAEGWISRPIGRLVREKDAWLSYRQGQKDLVIGLLSLSNGRTMIRVGDKLEDTSWQLAKPKPADSSTEAVGLEAADFPILNVSKTAKLDPQEKSIEFLIEAMPLAKVAEEYTRELEGLGWIADKGGVRSDDYTLLTFKKQKKEIELRARSDKGNASVNVQGDGLLWTKELPGGKQVISYETWLREKRHPATLELLGRYEAEMRAIDKTSR